MQFDPAGLDASAVYKLITGAVIPRPIAWVSTVNAQGVRNLAPFSFFNLVSEDPPHLLISTARTGHKNKDTLNNIIQTGEFVVNMVTPDCVAQMNDTAQAVPPEVDEFDLAGIESAPSVLVKPDRVAASPVQFECRLVHRYALENHANGGAELLVGRIVMMHFAPGLVDDRFRVNADQYRPVSRLAGSNYAHLGEVFSIKRKV